MEQITLKYENLDTEPYIVNSPASMHGGILYKKFSENFLHYNDKRIKISQVIDGIFNYIRQTEDPVDSHESYIVESINDINDKKYILPIAVATNPTDWADLDIYGKLVESKKSIFEIISPLAIKDLQNEKALLLIDQSIEGYHQLWLWDWFHKKCQHYNINPKTIIYMTGDQDSIVKYDKWAAENNVSAKLKVIPSITLSSYIRISYEDNELDMKFDELLEYKKNNTSTIYLYDCLNLRPRPQRVLNFLHLLNADLLKYGNVSMSDQSEWYGYLDITQAEFLASYKLPIDILNKLNSTEVTLLNNYSNLGEIKEYHIFYERILHNLYKNSWVSIVTESSYFSYEHSIFVSEKTFKPIACMQPFIIVGSRDTLKYLRKLGYKTFHPFIDESYDDLDDQHRLPAIMEALKKVQSIEDKVSWYSSMREIVEHNHKLFMLINKTKSLEHQELTKYYFECIKETDVQTAQ
jgi:hypothetical protein